MILPEHEANKLLADMGIPVIPIEAVESAERAMEKAAATGYPVVLKFSSAAFPHKTEIDGVSLNLKNAAEVEKAFVRLSLLRDRLDPGGRIIMEPMAPEGAEMFVGFQRNRQFGPVISVGLGGVFLELTGDVAFRLLPAKRADFAEMMTELRAWPKIRKGFRRLPPASEEHLLDLLEKTADFALRRADLDELDFNPVVVRRDGVQVLDAMIVLADIESS